MHGTSKAAQDKLEYSERTGRKNLSLRHTGNLRNTEKPGISKENGPNQTT